MAVKKLGFKPTIRTKQKMGGDILMVMDTCRKNSRYMASYLTEIVNQTGRARIDVNEIGRQSYHLLNPAVRQIQ